MSKKQERLEALIGTMNDLVGKFLYYDRKEDDTLPVGQIEKMIENGEVTKEAIISHFAEELNKEFSKIEVKTPTLF